MAQKEEKRSIIPLFIKAELVPDECNVVELCEACERVTGHGSIDGATLVNRLWRILPFNEVSRAKLLVEGVKLFGKHLMFEGKNPFLHASGNGECQTTRLIIKNLPFSYCQSAVARNLIKAGFKLRGNLQWMKGRKRKTGRLSDFRDGRRSVFIDVPTGKVDRTMQMGSFKATLAFPEMAITCYRCLQEGHTAKDCKNQEICHNCKKPGHRRDQCREYQEASDRDSDSEDDEPSRPSVPPNGKVSSASQPTSSERALLESSSTAASVESLKSCNVTYSDVVMGIPPIVTCLSKETVDSKADKVESSESALDSENGNFVKPSGASIDETLSEVGESDIFQETLNATEKCDASKSPLSEFIKSVEFAELPGSPRHPQNPPCVNVIPKILAHGVVQNRLRDVASVTPTIGVEPPVLESSASKPVELSSIWEDNTDSDESLIIMATNAAESGEPLESKVNNSSLAHRVTSEKKVVHETVVVPLSSNVPSSPEVSDIVEGASISTVKTDKEARDTTESGIELKAIPEAKGVSKGKNSGFSSVVKIKRAFSSILSPPSDKKSGDSEGPKLKKFNGDSESPIL